MRSSRSSLGWKWRHRSLLRLGIAALLAGHLGLLALFDLASHPYWTLASLTVAFAGLWLVARSGRDGRMVGTASLLMLAAVLRLLLLPLPPTLSDDILRYVWDGRVVRAGFNPYELAPEAPQLGDLRDASWEAIPHKEIETVYPPLALASFSIAALLPLSVYVLKALVGCIDLVGCFLLCRLASRRGLPTDRVALYAWNPLVTLEIAGMGHIDALGAAVTIACVLFLLPGARRVGSAGVAAAAGVAAKLVPLVALPMWARQSGRASRFLLIAGGLSLTVLGGLVLSVGGIPPGLTRYAISWEFNGPLFEPLHRLLAWLGAPEAVAWLLDGLKELTGRHELWNRFYPYRYPELLAKLLLAAGLAWWVARSLRFRDPVAGTGAFFAGVLLFSATLYPWYLLWVLPWAALCRQRAWLLLAGLVQLSYLPQLTPAALFPWVYLAIWVPFGIVWITRPQWSTD